MEVSATADVSPAVTTSASTPSTPGSPSTSASTPAAATAPEVVLGYGDIPSGKISEPVQVIVPLLNRGDGDALQVLVSPKPSVDPASFPFEITNTDYTVDVGTLASGASTDVDLGSFTLRGGLVTGYYAMPLSIQYGDGANRQVIEKTIFVHVDGLPAPEPGTPEPVTTVPPQTIEVVVTQPPVDTGGGGGYVPPIVTGNSGGNNNGGAPAGGSAPRVMLTAFTTNPPEVLAGHNFKLAFTLQNMSQRTGVGNVKVTVASADGSFLPVGGASSVYINWIGTGQAVGSELEFRGLPTLEERPYQLSLRIEYEDASNNSPLTTEETIAVVVRQQARAETSTIQVVPNQISVDQDANVSFTVQNKGKVRLYNTRVYVKANQPITGNEVFVGNVEPGASGTVDMMVHANEVTSEPFTVVISYEDAAGVETSMERQVNLEVMMGMETKPVEEPMQPTTSNGLGMLPILLGALLLIGGLVGGYIWRDRRRRRKEEELAASLEAMDAEPIVPTDPQ